MRFKSTLIASLLMAGSISPSFADETTYDTHSNFSAADIGVMFEQSAEHEQLAALSQPEMKRTEGAMVWAAPALGGAIANGVGYSYNNPNWNWAGFTTAVGTGALGGAVGGFGGWGLTLSGGLAASTINSWY